MTVIRPISKADIALQNRVKNAVVDANLNLSEVLALNESFDLGLEYSPKNDLIEITNYVNRNNPKGDMFVRKCGMEAIDLSSRTGKVISEYIEDTEEKSSLDANLKRALNKLKEFLK